MPTSSARRAPDHMLGLTRLLVRLPGAAVIAKPLAYLRILGPWCMAAVGPNGGLSTQQYGPAGSAVHSKARRIRCLLPTELHARSGISPQDRSPIPPRGASFTRRQSDLLSPMTNVSQSHDAVIIPKAPSLGRIGSW